MKRTPLLGMFVLVLIVGIVFLPACGQREEQPAPPQPAEPTTAPVEPTPAEPAPTGAEQPPMEQAPMEAPAAAAPEASGAALQEFLTQANYQQTWKMWPGKEALYQGTEPHGVLLTTYVNDAALAAIEGKQGKLPAGSLIVKENYGPDKNLMALTIMYRVEGYNPDAGDWFWLKYLPDGTVEAEGKVEACIACHGTKKDNDYIMTAPLK